MKELIEKILGEFAKENNGVISSEQFEEVSSELLNLVSEYRKKWKSFSDGSNLSIYFDKDFLGSKFSDYKLTLNSEMSYPFCNKQLI